MLFFLNGQFSHLLSEILLWSRKSFYLYPISPSCHGDLQFVPSLFSENSRGFAAKATQKESHRPLPSLIRSDFQQHTRWK